MASSSLSLSSQSRAARHRSLPGPLAAVRGTGVSTPPVTRKTKTNDKVVLHQPSAMEDFNKIGLLDFQSKNGLSGIIPSAFNSFSQNTGFLPFKEPALPRVNQNTALEGLEDSKNLQR